MNWELIAQHIITVAGSVAVAALPLLPALLPLATGWIKDERARQAFSLVSRAALLGANAGLTACLSALEKARRPDSPGGTTVTPDEWKDAVAAGVMAGIQWLQSHGAYHDVCEIYGGPDKVAEALRATVGHELAGNEGAPWNRAA